MTILAIAASIRESPSLQNIRGFATKCRTIYQHGVWLVLLGPGLQSSSVKCSLQTTSLGEFVCASFKNKFNLQNCCPFLKQFILFRWVWYWWHLTIHHFVYCATQCISRVIHAIAQSSQLGVFRGYVTITHKSLRISWLWLLPALADDAGNREFGVSLFECNLGLGWPAEVTITSNWRVNYPQDNELD